jgi:hypothetical protein
MSTTAGIRIGAMQPACALTETELTGLIQRCPVGQRWAFGGWLRGERHLDGDLIGHGVDDPEIPCAEATSAHRRAVTLR